MHSVREEGLLVQQLHSQYTSSVTGPAKPVRCYDASLTANLDWTSRREAERGVASGQ